MEVAGEEAMKGEEEEVKEGRRGSGEGEADEGREGGREEEREGGGKGDEKRADR